MSESRTVRALEKEVDKLNKRITKLEGGLISIRKSTEIMEARRFAEQALKGK